MDPEFTENTIIDKYTINFLEEDLIFFDSFSQVAEEIIDGQSNEQYENEVTLETFQIDNHEISETIGDDTNVTQQFSLLDDFNAADVEEEIIVDEQNGEEVVVVQVQYVNGNFLETQQIENEKNTSDDAAISERRPFIGIIPTDEQEHFTSDKETTSGYQRSFEKHVNVFYPKDGKVFKCRQCSIQFPTLSALSNHFKTIHNHITRRHSCEFCSKSFIWQCDLKRHLKLCPYNPKIKQQKTQLQQESTNRDKDYLKKPYICNFCSKSFDYRSQLKIHLKKHTGELSKKQFNCIYCSKSFSYRSLLEIHLRKHTGQSPKKEFVCNYCFKSFGYNSHLKLHLGIHTGKHHKKEFNCYYCPKSFGYKSHLEIHLRRHTGEGPKKKFNCDYCSKTFGYNSHLLLHLKKHTKEGHKKQYTCNFCNKIFGYPSHLAIHQRIHTDERPYSCSSCEQSFRTKKSLIEHQSVHTDAPSLACFLCKKVFKNQKYLDTHLKRCNSNYNKYKCQDCDAIFRNHKSLLTHQKTHTSTKNACKFCFKNFDTLAHLKFHLGVHTGERPFSCSVCEVAFKNQKSLLRHQKIHTNREKTYLCEICSKSFLTMLSLKRHYAAHSEERAFSCCWCGKSYKDKEYLNKHKRRFHSEQESKAVNKNPTNFNNELLKQSNDCNKDLLNISNDCINNSLTEPTKNSNDCSNDLLKDCNNDLLKKSNDCINDLLTDPEDESNTCINDLFEEASDNELLKESNDCITDLLKELNDEHNKDLIKKSDDCNKDLIMKSKDVQQDLETKKHVCDKCSKTFDKKCSLNTHYKIHSEERPYSCILCGKTFKIISSLHKHERVHLKQYTEEHRYKCSLCEKAFKDKRRWKEHERRHVEPDYKRDRRDKKHICEICSMKFRDFNHYQRHLQLHSVERRFSCNLCEKSYFLKPNLMRHLGKSHSVEVETFKNTVNIKHICEYCNKIFLCFSDLKRHLIVHSKERRHSCRICKKTYLHKFHLTRHLANSHSKEEVDSLNKERRHQTNKELATTEHICEYCNKCFSNNSQLGRHLMIHTKVRPYPCDLCEKDYIHKSHLKRHLAANHSKEEINAHKQNLTKIRYCCKFCDKNYKQEYLLKYHQKMHLKKKTNGDKNVLLKKNKICKICSKSFKQLNKLTNHLRRVHQTERNCVKPLSNCCDVCKKIFKSYLCLVVHIRHLHPNYDIKEEILKKNYKQNEQYKTNIIQKKKYKQNDPSNLCEIEASNPVVCEENLIDLTLITEISEIGASNPVVCEENLIDLTLITEISDKDPTDGKQNNISNAYETDVSSPVDYKKNRIDLTPITKVNDIDPTNEASTLVESAASTLVTCKENLIDLTPIPAINDVDPLEIQNLYNNNNETKVKTITSEEILNDSKYVADNVEEIVILNTDDHHRTTLKSQIRKVAGGRKYICEICSMKFDKFILYKKHLKLHSLERALCDKTYLKKAHLNKYLENSNSKEEVDVKLQHTCVNCNQNFNSIFQLECHLMTHNKKHLYSCTLCPKSFKHEYLLKYHHKMKHFLRKFKNKKKDLIRKNKICKICSKSFDRLYKLTTHLRRLHQTERNCVKKSTNLNYCPGLTFINEANDIDQFKVETNENQSLPSNSIETEIKLITTVEDYMEDNAEEFIISENIRGFSQQFRLDSEHRYHCSICEIIFKDKRSLKNHQSIHVKSTKIFRDEKKYVCEICSMEFAKFISYNKHLKLHSADRPFPCVLCDKAYLQNSHLIRHLASSHSKEEVNVVKQRSSNMKHTCEFCSKSFYSTYNLKRHLIIHTKEQVYSCNVCKKSYKHEYLLKNHRKKHLKQISCNDMGHVTKKNKICVKIPAEISKESVEDIANSEGFHSEIIIKDECSDVDTTCNDFPENLALEKDCINESRTSQEPKIRIKNVYYNYGNDKEKSFARYDSLEWNPPPDTNELIYSCSVCKKSFKNEFILKNHQKKHLQQETNGFSRDLLKQKRICRYCFKFFDGLNNLNIHISRVHHRKADNAKKATIVNELRRY